MIATLLFVAAFSGSAAPSEGPRYQVYVTAESSDLVCLAEFDADSGQARVVREIAVGYQPTEVEGPHGLCVAPDGEHWFVTVAHGKPYGLLYKYATATDELVGSCELGLFPATMQISDATGLLYCVNFDLHGRMKPSTVSIVDPDGMVEVARTTTGLMPHGSRITADGLKHYSCAMMGDELFEIDAVTFEVARVLYLTTEDGEEPPPARGAMDASMSMRPAKAKPTWVHPHPTEPRVYVALNGAAQVVEVDTESWEIVRRFPTAKAPYNLEVSADGRRLVVTHKGAASVGVWDLAEGTELARIPTSRKVTHGVVISPDGRYAFASNEGIGGEMGTLDVFDLERLERVATVEIGLQAGGIAFRRTLPAGG